MPVEIKVAAFGAVLLLIQILIATQLQTSQYGAKWNLSARDEGVAPPSPVTGRMIRAQANFEETFPIAIVALLGVVLANKTSASTALGAWIWLGARIVYVGLYAAGIPVVRTLCWLVSVVGLAMIIWPLLFG